MIGQIRACIPKKARWFDIIEISGTSTPVSFKNCRLHSITEKQNRGYGIRINIDGRTGFSYTNNSELIKDTVKRAVSMAPYGDSETFSLPESSEKKFDPYHKDIETFNLNDEIQRCNDIIRDIQKTYPDASIDMGISSSVSEVRLLNSSGLDLSYKNSYYSGSIAITLVNSDGTKLDIWESLSSLKPEDIALLKDNILLKLASARGTEKIPAGRIPLLLSPKAASRIIGIAASGLNGKSVYKGISPFADKLSQKMFNEKFTLYDDPLLEDSPFSFPIDDEGVQSRKKILIEKGVIKTFINDLKHSEKLKTGPTGNGSRGYSSLPNPGFSNIVIGGGNESCEDLISGIDRGIMADQFIGLGQSNTLTGDFSANLDLAYVIKGGKIKGRVKDCMAADNLFRMLSDDFFLSKETERSGSVTSPYILFPAVSFNC